MSETTVRFLTAEDSDAWHRLWDGYCEFYKVEMPAEVTATTWQRLLNDGTEDYIGIVAEREGAVIGIANCILHRTTWAIAQRCYLNDLYVDPEVRSSGAGKAMIDYLLELASERGWNQLHWLTAEDNATARRLYDAYSPASGFINYRLTPEAKA